MKNILTYLCLSLAVGLFGQTRPDQQPYATTIQDSDAFYSQNRGSLMQFRVDTLIKYFTPDKQSIQRTYTPGTDPVPWSDRYKIIQGADDNWYYIDADRDYIQIGQGSGSGSTNTVYLINSLSDTTSISSPIEGDIAYQDQNLTAFRDSDRWRVLNPSFTQATNIAFDGDRSILRVPTVGVNIGTDSVKQWLEWWYFAPPTITCNLSPSTTVYEVGTSNSITISGATTNAGGATLTSGALTRTVPSSNVVNSFGASTSYTAPITFTPQQGGSGDYDELAYSFQATQDWSFGSESGTASSTTRSLSGVYPVFYGMSATDLSAASGITIYTTLTKLVETEGNKTVTLTGTGFIYFAVPKTWSDFDLSQIIDHNGFTVTGSFTAYDVTVSSSGLTNDYTNQTYKIYKLNSSTTTSGFAYQFIR